MSYLPVEIVVGILSRLPVKSLLQFRCVSTSWLRLIDSSDFVKSHLNRTVRNNTNISLILIDGGNRLLEVDVDSLDGNNKNKDVTPLVHPQLTDRPRVCGYCNGLVCLSVSWFNKLVLWNPSTRKSRELPYRPRDLPRHPVHSVYGFGYDSVNDDYKVVGMVVPGSDYYSGCFEVDVYSLKSNSWHKAKRLPRDLRRRNAFKPTYSKFAGGAIHWLDIISVKIRRIIAFDLATEEHSLVPQPEYSRKDRPISIDSFRGCLTVICNNHGTNIGVWVMKDYGVKESWIKLVSLADRLPVGVKSFYPLAYLNGGVEILGHDKMKLVWFCVKGEKIINTAKVAGMNYLVDAQSCLRSLVPLYQG